jgi:hypothetical protein
MTEPQKSPPLYPARQEDGEQERVPIKDLFADEKDDYWSIQFDGVDEDDDFQDDQSTNSDYDESSQASAAAITNSRLLSQGTGTLQPDFESL